MEDGARQAEFRRRWHEASAGQPKLALLRPANLATFDPGLPDSELLQGGRKMIEFVRWAGGLGNSLSLTDGLNSDAQCGALLLATGGFDHYSPQPSGMPTDLYTRAARATAQGNISYRRGTANGLNAMILDQMADVGPNAFTTGHRRWILNPSLAKIGIGYLIKPATKEAFSTILVSDRSAPAPKWDATLWPGKGAFPMELVPRGLPWTITLNPDIYNLKRTDGWEISWQLNHGEIQTIKPQLENEGRPDQLWATWETSGYGVGNAIIFLPPNNHSLKSGDICDICFSGLRKYDGTEVSLNYSVHLFWMNPPQSSKGKKGRPD